MLEIVFFLLVQQLGDSAWRTREAAHKALHPFVLLACPFLERASAGPDREAACRADQLLRPIRAQKKKAWAERLAHTMRAKGLPTHTPWLLLPDYEELNEWVERARRRETTAGNPNYPEYREAARLWLAYWLYHGRSREELQIELDRMGEVEQEYHRRNMP